MPIAKAKVPCPPARRHAQICCALENDLSPPENRVSLSHRHLPHANDAFAQTVQKVSK